MNTAAREGPATGASGAPEGAAGTGTGPGATSGACTPLPRKEKPRRPLSLSGTHVALRETPAGARLAALTLGALGVVFGDIGTSPLYALRECFHGPHGIPATPENVLGVLWLIFWSLVLVITVKYVAIVMRADNDGEGGILALMALVSPPADATGTGRTLERNVIIALGLFGAALLYGDGMITPAISVLSAVEGLEVATPSLEPYVIPVTIVILAGIFQIQRFGTESVGRIFGPVTLLWFLAIAALGVVEIGAAPSVLRAANPLFAWRFIATDPAVAFFVLGAVVLVATGGEALYADMGHFGRKPIRLAWLAIVLPALLLNYFGQGALLLADPHAASNPFFLLVPASLRLPVVALATAATVIASQAVISGAFSLTRQAIQLGYLPRLEIRHTSAEEIGQIYVPQVNWGLFAATILLVLGFRTSSNLAAAYGIAVTMTMAITMLLIFFAMRRNWSMSFPVAGALTAFFLAIDLAFLGANAVKIEDGGWVPLAIGVVIFAVMATWRRGREILGERLREKTMPHEEFFRWIDERAPVRVPGTAVYLSGTPGGMPAPLVRNLRCNKVLHERIVLLRVVVERVPFVAPDQRVHVETIREGFLAVRARYGFMEDPDVPRVIEECCSQGLEHDDDLTYVLGRETLIATKRPGMAIWREHLFAFLSRNALRATAFFKIPPDHVMEIGSEIEL